MIYVVTRDIGDTCFYQRHIGCTCCYHKSFAVPAGIKGKYRWYLLVQGDILVIPVVTRDILTVPAGTKGKYRWYLLVQGDILALFMTTHVQY